MRQTAGWVICLLLQHLSRHLSAPSVEKTWYNSAAAIVGASIHIHTSFALPKGGAVSINATSVEVTRGALAVVCHTYKMPGSQYPPIVVAKGNCFSLMMSENRAISILIPGKCHFKFQSWMIIL